MDPLRGNGRHELMETPFRDHFTGLSKVENTSDGDSRPPPLSACEILYIEDNLDNLFLIEAILSTRPDIALVTAERARVGLEVARTRRPLLIFLDLHLPDMSGEDVLLSLKSNSDTATIPVVMLTAGTTEAKLQHCLALGARACLTKPIAASELFEVIDTIFVELENR